jgi:hypothetical protein
MNDDIGQLHKAVEDATLASGGVYGVTHRFVVELAKRVTVKVPPPKKAWSVSYDTAISLNDNMRFGGYIDAANRHAADIIRERPDLVADEVVRRYIEHGHRVPLAAFGDRNKHAALLYGFLFPDLDP